MRNLGLSRYALTNCVTAALLAGCGGSQPPVEAMARTPQSAATATQAKHRKSWMDPKAKTDDLLYVSNNDIGTVSVYSWRSRKLVGTLTGFSLPAGLCIGRAGNVFITDAGKSQIFEYAHGGTSPIATLSDPGYTPHGCSVDQTTDKLAVANLLTNAARAGDVVIYYPNASSPSAEYTAPNFYRYYFCGYDEEGNLFVDGKDETGFFEFAELPSGAGTFTNVALSQTMYDPGAVQWDGKYLAVGDNYFNKIYRFTISGSSGTLEGTTDLGDAPGSVYQFWIARFGNDSGKPPRARVVGPSYSFGSSGVSEVQYWKYPDGGSPTQTITKGLFSPFGVTVSKAKE